MEIAPRLSWVLYSVLSQAFGHFIYHSTLWLASLCIGDSLGLCMVDDQQGSVSVGSMLEW